MNPLFPRSFAPISPVKDSERTADDATAMVLLQLVRADPIAMEELIESGVLNHVLGISEPLFDATTGGVTEQIDRAAGHGTVGAVKRQGLSPSAPAPKAA